ncbi:MAG: TolC family protein [Sulfuricella denitrificans]|nr:TolC family protein [Sulfuricella denitrificans]
MKYVFIAFLISLQCATAHAGTATTDSLTFAQAETLLLARNREIQAAQRAVEGLRADGISAAQRPNPTLSLSVTSINPDHSNAGKYWDKPLDNIIRLDQTIEGGDKRDLRMKAAESAIHAGQEDAMDMIRQQRLALASSYYGLLLAQEKEDINRQSAALYGKSILASELRLKTGDISPTELSRLQVEALRAENDARQSLAEKEKAWQALAYLIGAERQNTPMRASGPWPEAVSTVDHEIESLLAQRPDVRAAQARVEMANARRAQARALLKRDVSVGVQYEHYPPDARNTVGVGVSFPLMANYQYQGEIQRAESDYGAALEAQEQVRAQALTEIRTTRSDLDAAADRLQRYRSDILAKAGKSAAAAEFAYSRGAISLLDLLDARRTLKAVQLEAASASYDYARALAAWTLFTNKL